MSLSWTGFKEEARLRWACGQLIPVGGTHGGFDGVREHLALGEAERKAPVEALMVMGRQPCRVWRLSDAGVAMAEAGRRLPLAGTHGGVAASTAFTSVWRWEH